MADKEKIRAFLLRVANDADYRTKLINDRVGALTEAGFTLTEAEIPPGDVKLPPNEEILAKVETLTDEIELVYRHIPHAEL